MAFACIHIPNFILQSAIRGDPAFRGAPGGRPVAIVEGAPPLEHVVAADRAAALRGVRLGLTRAQAEEFEGLAILKRSPALEKAAHAALLDLGWCFSPRIEDTAPDTIALDLDGLLGLFGSEKNIARRLVEGAAAMDFAVQVAVAENLDAAFYAARGYPGITLIPRGEEARFLGGLPLEALSLAPEMMEILESWGVRSCAALAALPVLQLSERLGQEGVRLHTLARGASRRSMIVAEPEGGFEEAMELDHAVAELEPLTFILARLLEQLCARLAARSLAASAIGMRFDLERSCKGDAAAVYEKTLALPVPMRDSGMLLSLVRLHLQSHPPSRAITKVVLSAVAAPPRGAQGGLFLPARPQPEKLELTIARLAHLVGDAHVGAPELVDTHRPGKFRMGPFTVHSERKGKRTGEGAEQEEKQAEQQEYGQGGGVAPRTAFRFFRPPVPARVELRNGRPARLFFQGQDAGVAAASGPWRTSGEWWEADAWQCDEWDVEVRFAFAPEAMSGASRESLQNSDRQTAGSSHADLSRASGGVYRIFFDGIRRGWFVRGVYD